MKLFIAEKPSVAKALCKELGIVKSNKGYVECKGGNVVTWCFGHLLEQAEPDFYLYGKNADKQPWTMDVLPIVPSKWHLEAKKDTKSQLRLIGQLLKKADEVINAGDPDREGQLLVDEILSYFGYKGKTLRFWVSAQDPISIKKGLSSLKPNESYTGMRLAAIGRSRADWLLGMNLTRAYTLHYRQIKKNLEKGEGLIAVGRVQTPTLAMVAKRDSEISVFKPVDYFTFKANCFAGEHEFLAYWKASEDMEGLDSEGRLVNEDKAKYLLKKLQNINLAKLVKFEQSLKKVSQPKSFSLAEIQLIASNKFGFSAEETLKTCQSLYEKHKLTSYPRTDCSYLPESQWSSAATILDSVAKTCPELSEFVRRANPAIKSPTWDDKKITAHHGIIPTIMVADFSSLSNQERMIYRLVAQRYICQFFGENEYLASEAVLDVGGESFIAKGKVIKQPGWKFVYRDEKKESEEIDKEEESDQSFPDLRKAKIQVKQVLCSKEKTRPPAAFTEGTLVQAMENIHLFVTDKESRKWLKEGDGIGTPATRAAIISELKNKGYLLVKGKKIHASDKGIIVLKNVSAKMRSPVITAVFERQLKDVELGKAKLADFLDRQISFIKKEVELCRSP